jgi:DNA-binding LacI/PurR family transcriptional regulator
LSSGSATNAIRIGRLAFTGAKRPVVLSFPVNRDRARALLVDAPGPVVIHTLTRHRWEGYLDAWRQAGGAPDDLWIAVCAANAAADAGLTTVWQSLRDQGARCARVALGHRPPAGQDPPAWRVVERVSTRPA